MKTLIIVLTFFLLFSCWTENEISEQKTLDENNITELLKNINLDKTNKGYYIDLAREYEKVWDLDKAIIVYKWYLNDNIDKENKKEDEVIYKNLWILYFQNWDIDKGITLYQDLSKIFQDSRYELEIVDYFISSWDSEKAIYYYRQYLIKWREQIKYYDDLLLR